MASNEESRLKAGGGLTLSMLVVRIEVEISVVSSEVVSSTLSHTVVEISVVPVTTELVDGLQEVTFPFTSCSSKRNDQYPVEPGKSG